MIDPFWLGVLYTLAALGGTVLLGAAFAFGILLIVIKLDG